MKELDLLLLCVGYVRGTHCPLSVCLMYGGIENPYTKAKHSGSVHGIRLCKNALRVSHFLFANDCYILFRATKKKGNEVFQILETYGDASRQLTNY